MAELAESSFHGLTNVSKKQGAVDILFDRTGKTWEQR